MRARLQGVQNDVQRVHLSDWEQKSNVTMENVVSVEEFRKILFENISGGFEPSITGVRKQRSTN